MTNSILIYPSYTVTVNGGNITFDNIFNTNKIYGLSLTFASDYDYMFYYKEIQDDTRLDLLAFREYNNSSYWDLLFYINEMESIFDLPTNYDNVHGMALEKLEKMEAKIGVIKSPVLRNETFQRLLDETIQQNEKHRKFRFVRPEYISQLVSIINGS
jgi:hypothetical protein